MKELYQQYIDILREELATAMGCTEPIAIAYAAASAREILGAFPASITAACSGSVIKNAKSVVVPHTGGLKGIAAAAVAGVVGGDPAGKLEVLSAVGPEQVPVIHKLLEQGICREELLDTPASLHVMVRLEGGGHTALVELCHTHTGIVRTERDGAVLLSLPFDPAREEQEGKSRRDCLTLEGICAFAAGVELREVRDLLELQIACNTRIAQAGMEEPYGCRVGSTLLETYGHRVENLARAYAAAGSDARMSGCELPVVINSGSGNQGITVSLPVIQYAKHLGADGEALCRALCVSNLVSVHIKSRIGRLSAFCGAVSAAAGAGAAISYLCGGDFREISDTIVNTLGNVSGIVCDGAKPSCAAKIASSVDAAILGFHMARRGRRFGNGDGIVREGAEDTIRSVSHMARSGMRATDQEILRLMIS